jgi:Putative MetA-pathway of phenol degradation
MRAAVIFLICWVFLGPTAAGWAAEQESSQPTVGTERKEEKKAARPLTAISEGGAISAGPQWRLVIEPSFEYDHITSQNVALSGFTIFEAILIGQVVVERVKRDIYLPAMTMRLGYKDAEVSLKVPYVFRSDTAVFPTPGGTGAIVQRGFSDSGIGDLQPYFYYHIIREGKWRPWVPDTILRVGMNFPTGKDPFNLNRQQVPGLGLVATEFPTGTGMWGATVGATFVKSADPAVLFLSVGYFYNFGRQVGVAGSPPINYGDIKLPNSFEYNLGFILALQEKFSINFALNQKIAGKTTQNGNPLPDTAINAIAFNIGATYVVSPRFSLDFLVGIGLTPDAPDVSLLVRMPMTFLF